jgi:hypothetical protein
VCSQESGECGGKLGKGSKCLQTSDCQAPLVCAGACQEALAQGAACQPFGGVPCQEGLQCTDKQCAPPVCK